MDNQVSVNTSYDPVVKPHQVYLEIVFHTPAGDVEFKSWNWFPENRVQVIGNEVCKMLNLPNLT